MGLRALSFLLLLTALGVVQPAKLIGQARAIVTVSGERLRIHATVTDVEVPGGLMFEWERRDRLCQIAQLGAVDCGVVHNALHEASQAAQRRGPRIWTMLLAVSAKDIGSHLRGLTSEDLQEYTVANSSRRYVMLDVHRGDKLDPWLDSVCISAQCKLMITNQLEQNPDFQMRFQESGLPNETHHFALPVDLELPDDPNLWGSAIQHNFSIPSRQIRMLQQNSQLSFQLRELQSLHAYAFPPQTYRDQVLYKKELQRAHSWDFAGRAYAGRTIPETPPLVDILFSIVARLQPATICVCGLNTAHSALLFLSATDHSRIVAYDDMQRPYTQIAADMISGEYPGRFELIEGDLQSQTEAEFFSANQHISCDFVFIDGAVAPEKSAPEPDFLRQVMNMRTLSHHETIVAMHGVHCTDSVLCGLPTSAWQRAIHLQTLKEAECFLRTDLTAGVCTGQYLLGSMDVNTHRGNPTSTLPETSSCSEIGKAYTWCDNNQRRPNAQRGNDILRQLIENSCQVTIVRLGGSEAFTVERAAQGVALEAHNGKSMWNDSGVFPDTLEVMDSFLKETIAGIKAATVLVDMWPNNWPHIPNIAHRFGCDAVRITNPSLTSFWGGDSWSLGGDAFGVQNPWIDSLRGKTVLVISMFSRTGPAQYARSDSRFPKVKELKWIVAPQALGGDRPRGYENRTWMDALADLKRRVTMIGHFDIALLSCGAYGTPLSNHIKSLGKSSIYLGGCLQGLFGIRGNRWEKWIGAHIKKYPKEASWWVHPHAIERPKFCERMEDCAYAQGSHTLP